MISLALYVHIPFCRSRCTYCDFNTYAGLEALAADYVGAVSAEAAWWAEALRQSDGYPPSVPTLYFGGGTPTRLAVGQLARLRDGLAAVLPWEDDAEVTVEANPTGLAADYLHCLRSLGVNRLSLGIQSFSDPELHRLGRRHDSQAAANAFLQARRSGFSNLSLDLIYALPDQTLASWQTNLERALALGPEHLSLYALSLEEGTSLARSVAAGRLPVPDPDLAADMYVWAEERLAAAGYVHYEISNWARPGYECQHNLAYWRRQPYLGLGAGAHSCWRDWRFSNVRAPADYVRQVAVAGGNGRPGPDFPSFVESGEHLDAAQTVAEALVLGLRMGAGVDWTELGRRYEEHHLRAYVGPLLDLAELGLVEGQNGRWRLTARGRLLSNQVFCRLIGS